MSAENKALAQRWEEWTEMDNLGMLMQLGAEIAVKKE